MDKNIQHFLNFLCQKSTFFISLPPTSILRTSYGHFNGSKGANGTPKFKDLMKKCISQITQR